MKKRVGDSSSSSSKKPSSSKRQTEMDSVGDDSASSIDERMKKAAFEIEFKIDDVDDEEDVEEKIKRMTREVASFYKEDNESKRKDKKVEKSIKKMVKRRILEGRFDDPAPALARDKLQTEEEYVQQLDPASALARDKVKTKASKLLKKIFLKLDALSHWETGPKPVIEDMTFDRKLPVPAAKKLKCSSSTAAVSEEVLDGKDDVKEGAKREGKRDDKKGKAKAEAAKRSEKKGNSEKPDNDK